MRAVCWLNGRIYPKKPRRRLHARSDEQAPALARNRRVYCFDVHHTKLMERVVQHRLFFGSEVVLCLLVQHIEKIDVMFGEIQVRRNWVAPWSRHPAKPDDTLHCQ